MNQLNYASLEACKRLVDAGIVLKTESCWRYGLDDKWSLVSVDWATTMMSNTLKVIPAPSMAEVWRELPETMRMSCRDTTSGHCNEDLRLLKDGNFLVAGYGEYSEIGRSENATDALIDLLIFVRK